MTRIKVLYLAGKGRSGTTILAALLGQLPGFFNAAEVLRLWDSAIVENHRCGCGLPFKECATWQAVLADADTLLAESGPAGRAIVPIAQARVDRDQAAVARWPRMLRLLRAKPGGNASWAQLDRYAAASSAVYRAIGHVTGARVVVDSSKIPIEPVALGLVPDIDVYLAHVVRDPRAVVFSWRRSVAWTDRDGGDIPRFGAAYTTLSWLARNLVVELIRNRAPFVRVRYDDLASDPGTVLRRLADLVGEPAGDLEFLTATTATIAPTHSVGGNPIRMTSGAVSIRPDEEWRAQISDRDRFVTTAMTAPLLRRYGFPVLRARADAAPMLATNAWLRFDAIRFGLRIADPDSVLEMGPGQGALGAWLARRYDYTGVELDATSRAVATSRIAEPGFGRVVERLDDLGDQRFGLVCAFEVLEHIDDDRGALERWRARLQPNGWIMLSVPAHEDRWSATDEIAGHFRRYERDKLTRLLEESGFGEVQIFSYGFGLGYALEHGRSFLARRIMARGYEGGETPEERTSASGRFFQPQNRAISLSFGALAAPFRAVQRPFRDTDVGMGYVVLARRRD